MEVKLYSTPTCGYCHQAKRYFSDHNIKYIEYDVSRDRAAADEMVKLTGQMGVPVIVVDGQVIVGFDRMRLEQLLAASSKGNGKKPSFGLRVATASEVVQSLDGNQISGVFVGKVGPQSLGEKLGLKKGDIINEVNSKPVDNVDDLEEVLAGLSKGSRIIMSFTRNNKPHQSEIIV